MQKLFVTGASGFLGSRIAEYYKDMYEVITVSHAQMDITDKEIVRNIIAKHKPDIVVHCAAVSDVAACEKNPEKSWKVNVEGSKNIAGICGMMSAKCILCSSDQVYFGSPLLESHDEEEELSPFNQYGRQKLTAEKECLAINPECVFLRLSWMYESVPRLEEVRRDFIKILLSQCENGEQLSYAVHDTRGITNVWEVIENLQKAFRLPGGVYNFGSPNNENNYETVLKLFQRLGLDTDSLKQDEEAFRTNPRDISMRQEKINRYDIYFESTTDGLFRVMKEIL